MKKIGRGEMVAIDFKAKSIVVFDVIPDGDYIVEIVESYGEGSTSYDRITFIFRVVSGKHQNCRFRDTIYLRHKSLKALALGVKKLNTLCEIFNLDSITETEILHKKPFIARVSIRINKDRDEEYTFAYGYKKVGVMNPNQEIAKW